MDSASALAELKQAQSTRKSAGDYYSQYEKELGATDVANQQKALRETIRGTEAQLAGVGESVAGRTRGTLTTESQRARLQALESQPIAEQLSKQQTGYSDLASEYQNLLSQVGTKSGMAYQSEADRLAALESTYQKLFEKEQAQKQYEQWLKEFEAERAAQAAQLAESRRQFDLNIAETRANTQRQLAQQASLYSQTKADQAAAQKAADEKSAALRKQEEQEYARLRSQAAGAEAERLKSTIPQYSSGNFLSDYGGSIGQYGPLALIGKGWAW